MGSGILRQYVASTICQFSAVVTGVGYVWFEPITKRLTEDPEFSLTTEQVSWIVSIVEIGGFLGPIISGDLTNRVGRKYVIMFVGPLSFFGWLILFYSRSVATLCFSRIIHGFAAGFASTVSSIYTAEISSPEIRGTLSGGFNNMLWYIGILFAFSIGPYLSFRNYIYACLPLPVIFALSFMFLPETPYYLLMKGKIQKARDSLEWLRDSENTEKELATMEKNIREEMDAGSSWKALFCDKKERKAFFILQIICWTKYFSGVVVLQNYALETFSKGESLFSPAVISIIYCLINVFMTITSAFMSDRIGRRPLLIVSIFGCCVGHLLTGSYFFLHEKTMVDASPYVWIMYVGLSMFSFFSSIGLSPLVMTLQAEMFSVSTRGVAGGLTEGLSAFICLTCLKLYTPVNEHVGVYANFWFYSVVCLLGGLATLVFMYETKGKVIGRIMENKSSIK